MLAGIVMAVEVVAEVADRIGSPKAITATRTPLAARLCARLVRINFNRQPILR
jgi:hypothetical protein